MNVPLDHPPGEPPAATGNAGQPGIATDKAAAAHEANQAMPAGGPAPPLSAPMPGRARSPLLMSRTDTALLVIDYQEKLVPHIFRHQLVTWNIRRLLDGARVLGVRRLATEQYPQGLGQTVAAIAERVTIDDEKALFSCRECEGVGRRIAEAGLGKVLLCGIETHVCVQQTALDFLGMGLDVWVAVDAVGSRSRLDHNTALGRMESAGVTLATTEAALFEWCETSAAPEFRRISSLVRESPPELTEAVASRYFPKTVPRYVLETLHEQEPGEGGRLKDHLRFIVRQTVDGREVARYEGEQILNPDRPDQPLSAKGITAVDIGSDGTTISVCHADGRIEMIYLPVGEPRTSHPRWKVRRFERHINSPEYGTDYEIIFHVVEYRTGNVFREFRGFEHRDKSGQKLTHASGVRQVEVSADGRWLILTLVGRPSELLALPGDRD